MGKFDRNDPVNANQLREQSERRNDPENYDENGYRKVDIYGSDHAAKIKAIRDKVLEKRNR